MRYLAVLLLSLGLAAPAQAYKLRKIVPQPKLMYFVALDDWKAPVHRVVKALNRAHVGVQLVEAQIADQATIQFGRLEGKQCGTAGVDGTTQTISDGNYSAIYLPIGCKPTQASIIVAHELGHALGLKHENRRCALMNASGTGPQSIPTQCLGHRYAWKTKPYRKDDIKGLKKLYRNTKPSVSLKLTGVSGTLAGFAASASDKEGNLSEIRFDYGDGDTETRFAGDPLPTTHSYAAPGTYTITMTAVDFYSAKGIGRITVTVV